MDTRPTTDKVKESLFNIIQFEIEGRRVLDLFGGTGQLGIEALSRGADHCTFVDMRKEAAALIRENLRLAGLSERSRVVQGTPCPSFPPAEKNLMSSCWTRLTTRSCWRRAWSGSQSLTFFGNMV